MGVAVTDGACGVEMAEDWCKVWATVVRRCVEMTAVGSVAACASNGWGEC